MANCPTNWTSSKEETTICGIFGFIGKSLNPTVSFDMANALLIKTEPRGELATGFYGVEHGDGRVFYDKEPIKASVYATRTIWKDVMSEADTDLLIGHCRQPSNGVASERTNRNNHPHVNRDLSVGMVHNGRVPEYNTLKSRYDLRSECDSEILLAMYEMGYHFQDQEEHLKKFFPNEPLELAWRLEGMREIFARVNFGAMAVAIAEREVNGDRYLWLFRDEDRPLHVVDMRKSLGQVFFCSMPEIWQKAVDMVPAVKALLMEQDQPIIEFGTNQVWMVRTKPVEEEAWLIKKYKVTKHKLVDYNEDEDKPLHLSRQPVEPCTEVVTRLDDHEDIVGGAFARGDEKKKIGHSYLHGGD